MQLVVPMAGLGQRFADAGYALPKPLIPVDGVAMIERAVADLPPYQKAVFIVHGEHQRRYSIGEHLVRRLPGACVVTTPGLTEGQACTVRLAAAELDPEQSTLVAACDNTHLYDRRTFEYVSRNSPFDCLVWTYRRDPRVLARPTAYGWVRTADDGVQALEVSCKSPISESPLEDHAVSGCFWFRRAGDMIAAIDRMVAENRRVNGEFYLDVVPNLLIEAGRRVGVFEVEKYIGWGTPHELEDYQRWQRYFSRRDASLVRIARDGKAVA
jgi:NDP-sugar pyrophosphorylase family protein